MGEEGAGARARAPASCPLPQPAAPAAAAAARGVVEVFWLCRLHVDIRPECSEGSAQGRAAMLPSKRAGDLMHQAERHTQAASKFRVVSGDTIERLKVCKQKKKKKKGRKKKKKKKGRRAKEKTQNQDLRIEGRK